MEEKYPRHRRGHYAVWWGEENCRHNIDSTHCTVQIDRTSLTDRIAQLDFQAKRIKGITNMAAVAFFRRTVSQAFFFCILSCIRVSRWLFWLPSELCFSYPLLLTLLWFSPNSTTESVLSTTTYTALSRIRRGVDSADYTLQLHLYGSYAQSARLHVTAFINTNTSAAVTLDMSLWWP